MTDDSPLADMDAEREGRSAAARLGRPPLDTHSARRTVLRTLVFAAGHGSRPLPVNQDAGFVAEHPGPVAGRDEQGITWAGLYLRAIAHEVSDVPRDNVLTVGH